MGKRYLLFALLFTLIGLAVPSIASASTPNWQTWADEAVIHWQQVTPNPPIIVTRVKCDPGTLAYVNVPVDEEGMIEPSPRDIVWEVHICYRTWITLSPAVKCYTMIHELGHLYGLDHRDSGVMFPFVPDYIRLPRCRKYGQPSWWSPVPDSIPLRKDVNNER